MVRSFPPGGKFQKAAARHGPRPSEIHISDAKSYPNEAFSILVLTVARHILLPGASFEKSSHPPAAWPGPSDIRFQVTSCPNEAISIPTMVIFDLDSCLPTLVPQAASKEDPL